MASSYLIGQYCISSSLYDFVSHKIEYLLPSDVRFFVHLVASSFVSLSRRNAWSRGVELPSQVIDRLFGYRFSPRRLENAGLIEVAPYSTALHQCRAYNVEPNLFAEILALMDQPTEHASRERLVNLIDGKDAPVRSAYKASHVPATRFLYDAVSCFGACPFDGAALDAHLVSLRKIAEAAPAELVERLRRRYQNDVVCAHRIRVGSVLCGNGIYEYRPQYRVIYTGRVAEVGGGLQSCSREMKLAALSTIPDVRNYDLRAAQAFALLQDLEDAGLEREWLATFLACPTATDDLAAKLGLPKDVLKVCLT